MKWNLFAANRKATLLGLSALAALFVTVLDASAQTPPPCPAVVTSNTTLTSDCVGTIMVAASGVRLNLGGHTVTCPGPLNGITIEPGLSSVRVTNGTVANCDIDIFVSNGDSHEVATNLNLVNFGTAAIVLQATNNSHLRSIVIISNPAAAASSDVQLLQGSSNNILDSLTIPCPSPCVASNPSVVTGIFIDTGSMNNVIASSSVSSAQTGIELNGDSNTVKSSMVSKTSTVGISLNSSNNTIESNTINNNGNDAIDIATGTSGNVITGNSVDMNGSGIQVFTGSTSNTIQRNTALNNKPGFDLADDNPGCDSNVWARNTFDTANQSCIH